MKSILPVAEPHWINKVVHVFSIHTLLLFALHSNLWDQRAPATRHSREIHPVGNYRCRATQGDLHTYYNKIVATPQRPRIIHYLGKTVLEKFRKIPEKDDLADLSPTLVRGIFQAKGNWRSFFLWAPTGNFGSTKAPTEPNLLFRHTCPFTLRFDVTREHWLDTNIFFKLFDQIR